MVGLLELESRNHAVVVRVECWPSKEKKSFYCWNETVQVNQQKNM